MALSDEQIQRNRRTLFENIRLRLGLPADRSAWPYEKIREHQIGVAEYILAHPASFAEIDLFNARNIVGNTVDSLDDATFNWGEFASEAAAPLAAVGEGAKNTLSLSKWLLPVAAIAAGVILLGALAVRTGAAKARAL